MTDCAQRQTSSRICLRAISHSSVFSLINTPLNQILSIIGQIVGIEQWINCDIFGVSWATYMPCLTPVTNNFISRIIAHYVFKNYLSMSEIPRLNRFVDQSDPFSCFQERPS